MKAVSNEVLVQGIEESKIRVIRALRLALTALHDAGTDIAVISPSGHSMPKEVRNAQIKAWNIVGELLAEAAKSIKAYQKDYVLADLSTLIEKCKGVLRVKREDEAEEMLDPLKERLRKFKENRKRKPGS